MVLNFTLAFFTNLWNLTLELSLWLLIGFFFAGILKAFVPSSFINKQVGGKDMLSVIKAALLGIPLPLCSCGVIPTGVSFYKNGASKAATNSFLISTPQTGVDSIFATYALLGLPLAIARPIIALFTGVLGGWLTNQIEKEDSEKQIIAFAESDILEKKFNNRIVIALNYGFVDIVQDISKWLIIGLLIATLISTILPESFFSEIMTNYWTQLFSALLISIPLYVCATGSIPIAATLIAKGLAPGAAILFLIAGPATNTATISVLYKTLGKRSTIAYLLSILVGALISAFVIDFFFADIVNNSLKSISHLHQKNSFISYVSAILLVLILLFANFKKYFSVKQKMTTDTIKINVEGMTCSHCKKSIETNLSTIDGVSFVEAFPTKNEVLLKGKFNMQEVKEIVKKIGFDFINK